MLKKAVKSFLFSSLLMSMAGAQVFDAIALIVEGEPITVGEIRAVQGQMRVSKMDAMSLLIQDRLEKVAMKNIIVPPSEVDQKVAMIAANNNISVPKMQEILKSQGTSWTKYRESITNAIKKEKFFTQYVSKEVPDPSETEMKQFYAKYQQQFIMPSTINVTEYSASTKEGAEQFLKTKTGLKGTTSNKSTKSLDPTMMGMFMQTPNGGYTHPINAGNRYVVYKVNTKSGSMPIDYESAKPAIIGRWKQEQQGKALQDYFNKMRSKADIEILRD